jgi:hypothetical protein
LQASGYDLPVPVFAAVQRGGGRPSWTPSVAQLRELQRLAGNRHVGQLLRGEGRSAHHAAASGAPRCSSGAGARRAPEEEPRQPRPELAAARERTGLPDRLRSGIEELSGIDLSNVRVHTNSDKPAQIKALAYARGTDIHVAPGQEQHVPHEAWHVVQQAQGRVKPTMEMNNGVQVNDDEGLEREAEVMGGKALSSQAQLENSPVSPPAAGRAVDAALAGAGEPARSDHRPVQRVGEEKKDFRLEATDSEAYRTGLALFQEALKALRVLRQAEKAKIWASVKDLKKEGKKPADNKSFSEAYGGGLRNLNNLDLLVKTGQFVATAPPRLVLKDKKEVRYEQAAASDGTKPTESVLIATLSDRTFKAPAAPPKEAKRDVVVGGEAKEYVRDSRGVVTRRFAYVEKNYWQFMEFVARNKLEGRYQNFFRAANPGADRPSVRGTRKSEARMVTAEEGKELTDEQLAVLHQWKGSGLQQRGLSLTSTPRKGETIGNAGENFRTTVGVRLTIDLARIPTGRESPIMINHYASRGVKDKPARTSEKYEYINSVIKNRELFLEFVKPEWITRIEYHDKAREKEFKLGDSGDAKEMMDAARAGTGYAKFAAGFEARITDAALDTVSADDEDYKSGVAFAEEYNRGYEKGAKEDAVVRASPTASVDPLDKIGGFDPKQQKDVFAIGRIHARLRRPKPKNLPAIWS